jgi:nicotinamide-nucleotide adenylyltransferase
MSSEGSERIPAGSVHGRFQPLHNGHLEYILAAFERCDFVYVGITQYLRDRLIQVEPPDAGHRALPSSNPLTYYERLQIIETVLTSQGIDRNRFDVTPFPIEEPQQLDQFIPNHVPVFTTTYDEWNQAKIKTLEEQGYEVINLWTRAQKKYVGKDIREQLAAGDPGWRTSVPASAIGPLEEMAVGERLRTLVLTK